MILMKQRRTRDLAVAVLVSYFACLSYAGFGGHWVKVNTDHQSNALNENSFRKLLVVRGGSIGESSENFQTNDSKGELPGNVKIFDDESEELSDQSKLLLEDIQSSEEVFQIFKSAMKIPAILLNYDGALRISDASPEDAILATTALYKCATLHSEKDKSEITDKDARQTDLNEITSDRRFQQLLEIERCQLNSLSASDLSKLVWSLAILEYRDSELHQEIESALINKLNRSLESQLPTGTSLNENDIVFSIPTALASFAHARTRLGFTSEAFFEKANQVLLSHVHRFPPSELAKIAASYAVSGISAKSLLSSIADSICALPNNVRISGKDASTLCWVIAMQGINRRDVFRRLTDQILPSISSLKVQDLSNLAYGLAKTHLERFAVCIENDNSLDILSENGEEESKVIREDFLRERDIFVDIVMQADLQFEKFRDKPTHLSRLLWALATWQLDSIPMDSQEYTIPGCSVLSARAIFLTESSSQLYSLNELADIIWAYIVLTTADKDRISVYISSRVVGLGAGHQLSEVFGRLCSTFEENIDSMNSHSICRLLWAFAVLRFPANRLLTKVCDILVHRIDDLPFDLMSMVAWSYARLEHPADDLISRIKSVAELQLDCMGLNYIANLLWALGKLGYSLQLRCPFSLSEQKLKGLNPSSLANLAFGLARTNALQTRGKFPRSFYEDVFLPLALDICPKLLSFSPRELSRCAAALDSFGPKPPSLDEMESEGDIVDANEVKQTANMLLKTLFSECSKWITVFTPIELADILSCMHTWEYRADSVIALIQNDIDRRKDALADLSADTASTMAFQLGICTHLLEMYSRLDFEDKN